MRRSRDAVGDAHRARRPITRRVAAVTLASMLTQLRLPAHTPATSSTAPAAPWTDAVLCAAAKSAAQEMIVAGFEAVPASAERERAPGR